MSKILSSFNLTNLNLTIYKVHFLKTLFSKLILYFFGRGGLKKIFFTLSLQISYPWKWGGGGLKLSSIFKVSLCFLTPSKNRFWWGSHSVRSKTSLNMEITEKISGIEESIFFLLKSYLHIYLPTYLLTYLLTMYLPTYLPTYLLTYLPTHLLTY